MPMVPRFLIAALATLLAAAADPSELAARLGSADPAARTEAARALEALGRDALPALAEAARADDPDVRERSSAVWETIQRGLAVRPSLVRLDGRNRPMSSVLDDLQTQTGITLHGEQVSSRDEPVTLHEPEPIAFWSALQQLGLNGVSYRSEARGKFPALDLRAAPAPAFVSIDGPFRIVLTGLHLHRDHQLVRGPWIRVDRFGQRINVRPDELYPEATAFFGDLEVMLEPRAWFTQEAPVRLTEAVDDLGQSLVPHPADRESRLKDGVHIAFYGNGGATPLRTEFQLRVSDRLGRTARLRGVLPLMLHVRRPAPALVIPLAGAAGKTFRAEDAEFSIHSVDDSPSATSVSMTVRIDVDNADLPEHPHPQLIMTRPSVLGQHQLELVDADGAVLGDSPSGGSGGGATPAAYQWTIRTFRNGRATHLRYYRMLRTRADATFDFRSVPLP